MKSNFSLLSLLGGLFRRKANILSCGDDPARLKKSEEEWKKTLSPEQYQIMRRAGTERAFTGKYWDNHETGVYRCAACGEELFSSASKYDSGSGWPSFWEAVGQDKVTLKSDNSLFMARVECVCANCGGHLGHLFDDGPKPSGQRYCINSACLDFNPQSPTA